MTQEEILKIIVDDSKEDICLEPDNEIFLERLFERVYPIKEGFTYFIEALDINLIKIGSSIDVEKRFKELSSPSPIRLKLLTTIKGMEWELLLQKRFNAFSWKHGEWFYPHSEIFKLIIKIKDKGF